MRTLLFMILLFCAPAILAPAHGVAAQSPLQRLITEFNELEASKSRGGRRDLWLSLEDKFAALQPKSKGETAAEAAFYRARARQELGNRSFVASDHREAARLYGIVADKHDKYPVAPESLLRQGTILLERLDDTSAGVKALERLRRSYPKSRQAAAAQALLVKAGTGEAGARPKREVGGRPETASSVTLRKITWKGKTQRAVVTLELDEGADFAYNFLPPDPVKKIPGRLYLDIAGAFPSGAIKPGVTPKNLVVSRIRTSSSGEGTRVTLECDDLRCYLVRVPDDAPRTIEIEVSRKEDIEGGVVVAAAGKAAGGKGSGKTQRAGKDDKVSVMEQLGLTVKTIMLDAGHGGKDPGAMAGGIVERQFTLDMGKRVGTLLAKEGFTVLYTRTGNKYISLQDRPDIANDKKADLFVSLHVNANKNPTVHGLETYYLDEAKTQDAAVVAARENSVSVKNISDLQFILTDLMLSYKVKESRHLARCVHKGILQRLRGAKMRVHDNGVRSAPFYVLMGARMPAILVEFGYITNANDLENLKSEKYLQRQAEGIVEGILQYRKELASAVPQ